MTDRIARVARVEARGIATRLAPALCLAACLLLTFALYGRALGFAFFFDDTYDLPRVEGRSYWSLLASSDGYQYYRPIPFLVWKFLRDLQGYYDQRLLHAIPLLVHALAGWFLYLLLRRLGAGNWGIVPAILFLTYPFHYQVVPIVGTLFHPLAALAILASLTLYASARIDGRRWAAVAAVGATLVALWSHESGVAVVPLLLVVEIAVRWGQGGRGRSAWLLPHLLAAGAFLATWSLVDKAPNTERTQLGELHPKLLFFLQGFTYPASAQIGWLGQHAGLDLGTLKVALAAIMVVLVVVAVSARRAGRRRLALVPMLAFAVALAAFLPALARLSWGYVENGPRLLYLPALGAAVFWGLLPALRFRDRRLTAAWRVTTLLLLLGVVVQSWRFVDVRMDMFARGTATIDQIVAIGQAHDGGRLLVVNAPSWLAQNSYEYRYGHYGVQLMPDYIGLDRVIYTSSRHAARVDARSVSWQPDVSGGPYPFGPHGGVAPPEELDATLREGRTLVVVTTTPRAYLAHEVGQLVPGSATIPPDAPGRLGPGIWPGPPRAVPAAQPRGYVAIAWDWNVMQAPGADLDALVEVRDQGDRLVASYTGYPLGGASAPRLWRPGDRLRDSIVIPQPPPGSYQVWVGLRHPSPGERLPAFDASGQPIDGGMLEIGAVTVAP